MRLSAKAQYACVAMVHLACNHGEGNLVGLKGISAQHSIPQPFLVQILLQLKANGLVDSLRGASGGYQLARPPDEITVGEIIRAIDQAPPQVSALAGLHATPVVQTVALVLADLQRQAQEHLEEVTLADLVRQTDPQGTLSYQI